MTKRVLLINPKPGDYSRVSGILRNYREKYGHEPARGRYNHIAYTQPDNLAAGIVAVWHSEHQITLHFGPEDDEESP